MLNWARWDFFAPESLLTKDGRRVMWAWCTPWINDMQKTDRKKNFDNLLNKEIFQQGIQSLPRETQPAQGWRAAHQAPARTGATARGPAAGEKHHRQERHRASPRDIQGDTMELEVVIAAPQAKEFGINLLCDEKGGSGFTIASGAGKQDLDGGLHQSSVRARANEDLTLRIFIDKSMIEVFANDRQAAVAWHEYPPGSLHVSLFAKGGDLAVKQVTAWKMRIHLRGG